MIKGELGLRSREVGFGGEMGFFRGKEVYKIRFYVEVGGWRFSF